MRAPLSLLVTVLLVGTGLGGFYLLRSNRESRRETVEPTRAVEAAAADVESAAPLRGDSSRRAIVDQERAPATTSALVALEIPNSGAAEPSPDHVHLHGSVLDPSALPVADVIVVMGAARSAPSSSSGAFELFVTHDARGSLTIESGEWFCVRPIRLDPSGFEREQRLLVLPAVGIAGKVIDGAGRGLAGARLAVELSSSFEESFPHPLDRNDRERATARSDAEGRFTIARAPGPLPGVAVRITARLAGYVDVWQDVPLGDATQLLLELNAEAEAEDPIGTGTVLRPDGSPAAGARVYLGDQTARTDETGVFRMSLDEVYDGRVPLAAAERGLAPTWLPEYGRLVVEARPAAPPHVTLVLGERTLTIRGHVTDEKERRLPGWTVVVADGTNLTPFRTPPRLLEALAGGVVEITTGADGDFLLKGLLPRNYVVRAYDPDTLVVVEEEAVAAGTDDLLLRVTADLVHARMSGSVTSPDGATVSDVRISVALTTARTEFGSSWIEGQSTVSDGNGAFFFTHVPRAHIFLMLGGESVVPTTFEPEPGMDVTALVVPVARRCHFRIVTNGELDTGLGIEVLDAAGKKLSIYRFRGGGMSSSTWSRLESESSSILAVSERARVFVLKRTGADPLDVILRRDVSLLPGEVTEVTLDLP